MNIKLSHTGYLKVPGVSNGGTIDIEAGTTVTSLLSQLGVKAEQHRFIIPMVNGEERRPSYELKENDDLLLLMPIGGG